MKSARWTSEQYEQLTNERQKAKDDAMVKEAGKITIKDLKEALQRSVTKAERAESILETTIQQQVVKWFAWKYPEAYKTGALFAVPNEGKRTRATASRMRSEGMVSGVADLILLLPRGGFHGACFEMKSEKGKLTKGQSDWLNARILEEYFCDVFFSYEQAVQGIEQYMSLEK